MSTERRVPNSTPESNAESIRTFFSREMLFEDDTGMVPKPVTRDAVSSLSPVVGFGLSVAITLTAAIAVGFLAVTIVG